MKILLTILLTVTLLSLIATIIYYRYRLVKEKYINLKLNLEWCDIVKVCKDEPSFIDILNRRIQVTEIYKELLETNTLLKIFVLRRENKRN